MFDLTSKVVMGAARTPPENRRSIAAIGMAPLAHDAALPVQPTVLLACCCSSTVALVPPALAAIHLAWGSGFLFPPADAGRKQPTAERDP